MRFMWKWSIDDYLSLSTVVFHFIFFNWFGQWRLFFPLVSCFVAHFCCFFWILQLHFLYVLIQVCLSFLKCFIRLSLFSIIDIYVFYFFGLGAPFSLNTTLKFCSYNGSTCCNSIQDAQIQKQFQVMNVSDTACASLLKSILCAVRSCLSLKFYLFWWETKEQEKTFMVFIWYMK